MQTKPFNFLIVFIFGMDGKIVQCSRIKGNEKYPCTVSIVRKTENILLLQQEPVQGTEDSVAGNSDTT